MMLIQFLTLVHQAPDTGFVWTPGRVSSSSTLLLTASLTPQRSPLFRFNRPASWPIVLTVTAPCWPALRLAAEVVWDDGW
ncbi:unnamed protein product [Protopolystoma xenopodis]|uniref:Uncharacterized protein n=1 Tax=Protopolystoma xenopodis TaxID=117903 RepID=A0A448WWL7_9PLAT|nr:unnamed protein product [Protopolystoma xenopodis]